MRILQCDERDPPLIPLEKRLGVREVGVAEVKRADRRVPAALEGIVEIEPSQLFVLAELPNQSSAGFLQRSEAALDWLAPACTTEGCNNSLRLENDH